MVMDKKTKITLVIAALLGALLILTLLQLIWAPQRWLTLEQFFTGLFVEDSGYRVIIFQHNATRVTMGLFVGGGLAVSGVVMQALFRNPMASPY
ncbi:MAG TPA: iron chelate uptake ABC transporter family permease subunit, partial [Candidatus Methanomethylophilaceae archaeon]|nr:iron chelate uptake ABC transporter family permease subunit [Candidatus Methanomethylophilaceae archaeon]